MTLLPQRVFQEQMSGRFCELDEALGRTRADVREGLEGVRICADGVREVTARCCSDTVKEICLKLAFIVDVSRLERAMGMGPVE